MNVQEILADIHSLEEDLLAFERRFGIRSETFYATYVNGEEPEDDALGARVWRVGECLSNLARTSGGLPE